MNNNTISAEYIDHLGSDLTVVNAARVSFSKESVWDFNPAATGNVLNQADTRLIAYLAKHKHFTPFTHPQITLRETVPICIARQRFKHVVGFSYNEVSRRYVDDTPEFYIPDTWRGRPEGSMKQGSSGLIENQDLAHSRYQELLVQARQLYEDFLEAGVAPEQARMVLPQSMLTSYYVTGSLAAFARMYQLRMDPHAQQEIQLLATQVGQIIEPLYPVSWKALTQA